MPESRTPGDAIDRLIEIMARLRDPDTGCPWDIKQSFETIAPYTIEEAYEVAEAISNNDMPALKDELGDLLFQVVFHGRMAEETAAFDFADIADAISEKMITRHPHIFEQREIRSAEAQTVAWEDQKAAERDAKAAAEGREPSALDGVSTAYPALMRAVKLQKRAARVGFDWPNKEQILDKLQEELDEVRVEIEAERLVPEKIEDEIGDLLFVCVNIARAYGVDPETALRNCNQKFERRFRQVEDMVRATGRTITDADLEEMERNWQIAKSKEKH